MEEQKQFPTTDELRRILGQMGLHSVADDAISAFRSEEDGCPYAVWRIDADGATYVLKRAKGYEAETYRVFFREKKPYAPALFGSCESDGATYLLLEYCPGRDLRICETEALKKALDALIEAQDEYWERADLYGAAVTLDRALEGIRNRGKYLGSALLEQAYAQFIACYRTTPRTLCHDDLLPINVLIGERAVLIDWEYGGVLPYLSSFARLIAHGREDKDAYFYMTRADRSFAIEYYYENLVRRHGIPYGEYRHALDLFLFYEYCEWIMLGIRYNGRDDERFGYYLQLAEELAPKLIEHGNPSGEVRI